MTALRFSRATFGESHIQLLIKSYSSSLKFRSQCFKIFSIFRRILVSIIRTRQSFNFDNIILQGFIYRIKSETMPKPKFKMEKLCHGSYSKFDQYVFDLMCVMNIQCNENILYLTHRCYMNLGLCINNTCFATTDSFALR